MQTNRDYNLIYRQCKEIYETEIPNMAVFFTKYLVNHDSERNRININI